GRLLGASKPLLGPVPRTSRRAGTRQLGGGATTRAAPLISTQTTGLRDPPIVSAFPPAVSSPSSRGRGTASARRRGAEPRARDRRGCRGGDTSRLRRSP